MSRGVRPNSMLRRAAGLVLIITVLLATATRTTHAFLSSLLGLSEETAVDPSRHIVLASSTGSSERDSGSNRGGPTFHLPSLASLHANLKELVAHGDTIPPRCRGASQEGELYRRCQSLTPSDKTWLAVAFTECHFQLYTHKYKFDNGPSCQELKDGPEMAECVKDMNTNDVFPIFIQFKNSLETLCQEVDHSFSRRKAHEAMDAIMDATLHTAKSLSLLQTGTEVLTSELQTRLEHSSTAVLELLTSHSQVEAERFHALAASASKLEEGQEGLMTQLESQTRHVKDLLQDAHSIQRLINATSSDIAATQEDILTLQQSAVSVLDYTKTELIDLKQSQQQHFKDALQWLNLLRTLSDTLHEAQLENTDAVARLATEQEQAFLSAAANIAKLHEAQTTAFKDGAAKLDSIRILQSDITASQNDLLSSVKMSSDELRNLADTQRTNFEQTGASLHRIQTQAAEVESKLGAMLLEIKSLASQLLNLNMDVLAELFHIQSAVFYVALTPLVYFATATERTKAARFWIFLLLISTLLLELNLVSTMQRFQYHLSQVQFDALRERLRYALAVLSLLILTLTALLHKDYVQLNHALNERNSKVLHNNHRMLHELLRRTEKLARKKHSDNEEEEEAPKSYYPPNPFQQPPNKNQPKENPAKEGHPHINTDSEMPDLEPWHSTQVEGPNACCADQRTSEGMFGNLFSTPRANTTSGNQNATTEVKSEQGDTANTTLISPRWSASSSPVSAAAAAFHSSDDEPGADLDDSTSAEEGSRRRSSRSRSRAPDVPEPTSAGKKKKTPGAIKEEMAAEEEEEPGKPARSTKPRKRSSN